MVHALSSHRLLDFAPTTLIFLSFHLADIVLLPSTDTRGFGATIGYGMSMSLFHRLEVGIGGTASIWNQPTQGLLFQNGPALS